MRRFDRASVRRPGARRLGALGTLLVLGAAACTRAGAATPRPRPRPAPPSRPTISPSAVLGGPLGTAATAGPAVVTMTMWSAALRQRVQVLVYLPPGYPAPGVRYPVLYLLHGVPGSAPSMFSGLDLESRLTQLITRGAVPPMLVIAPSDGPTPATDTEWTDSPVQSSSRWGTFVSRDLVGWADATFPACADRGGRAIGGLSMGAFGAINLALHDLGEFGSVTMWSGYFLGNTPQIEGPEGSDGWWNDSPQEYLTTFLSQLRRDPLRISFYVGANDPFGFTAENVAFARLLSAHGIPYRFHIYPGGHDYALWSAHLASELTWLGQGLRC